MLNLLDTEAEPCCERQFQRTVKEHLHFWQCPKCGQEYRVEVLGPLRFWRAYTWVAVLR
jgi:ribosomal protein L37AE/L43A